MRSSRLVTGLVAVAIGLAAGWMARGWFGSIAPEAEDRRASGTAASADPVPPLPLVSPNKPTAPAEPSAALQLVQKMIGAKPEDGSPLETFTIDQFATFLDRHQRTASSLLAVWNLTKDKAVLREAFEKFPGDPSVVLQAFQHLDLTAEKKFFPKRSMRSPGMCRTWTNPGSTSTCKSWNSVANVKRSSGRKRITVRHRRNRVPSESQRGPS